MSPSSQRHRRHRHSYRQRDDRRPEPHHRVECEVDDQGVRPPGRRECVEAGHHVLPTPSGHDGQGVRDLDPVPDLPGHAVVDAAEGQRRMRSAPVQGLHRGEFRRLLGLHHPRRPVTDDELQRGAHEYRDQADA